MNKIAIVLIMFLCIGSTNIKDFDVRGVNWGMTMEEVISSEVPLKPIIKDNEVEFKNVDLEDNFSARLIYSFSNGKLIGLKYIVHGTPYSKGTCDKIIPLTQKVKSLSFIFNALKSKNYKCRAGWSAGSHYLVEVTNDKEDYFNCSIDNETVTLIDNLAKEKSESKVKVSLENERCNAYFNFNEHQNTPKLEGMPCESDYYNTLLWLEIKPSYKVKKETRSSKF